MTGFRPTVADIDLEAIRANVRRLRPPGAELMAVVKADGYGHGAAPVARAALEAGATWLGVATVEEGLSLRGSGLEAPILVLSEIPRGAEREALGASLVPTVYTHDSIAALAAISQAMCRRTPVHLKIDTGMHRVGVWPPEAAPGFARAIVDSGLLLEGVFTHFASADSDAEATAIQFDRFIAATDAMAESGYRPRYRHAANSAATLLFPHAHLDMVRPGIGLYGLAGGTGLEQGLHPALTLRSRVSLVKRLDAGERISYGGEYALGSVSTVATVPIGYADGYPRLAFPGGAVLIRGRRFPIAGRVTMDQVLVDCGDASVEPGDEVVLIGRQGEERIAVEELAALASTIPHEIVTGLTARVPRRHS